MSADDDRVFKVIHLVATSSASWERATELGVAEAAKTIRDLDTARLRKADVVIRDGGAALYRVKLEAAFRIDRMRTVEPGAPPVRVHRYLVVANETLSSPGLAAAIRERHLMGPSEFHMLVPATPGSGSSTAFLGDPLAGYGGMDADAIAAARAKATSDAQDRLTDHQRRMDELGVDYTSEVGPPDALQAVMQVMGRSSFDEIIISTLPQTISRWLHMDLPRRVERATHLPVAVFTPAE